MTRDTAERARELAQWVHEKLCCAQNLPWEEGDICDDCLESAKTELIAIQKLQSEAREQLAAWMVEHSFSTGHGDTFKDLLKELDWQVKELRKNAAEARAAGIEEAARLADKFTNPLVVAEKLSWLESPMTFSRVMKVIADEIRALAQALQLGEKEAGK